ncbi:type II toxin-antitoxin system RelE/ParE family toxin [Vibrio ziniensis]|uniref:Type II toxin-antitoxin system RelE/ParE family toxin n=1 Tax=Vibrio ziniensis TaxID=2711221 RepID=A0A6G7CLN7_9VIBR|nr:type II toxin-antitoxin system RelE/ParE family toxin [Vibrio ziniensis]QIH43019.1 type II toxin-antitoxin system RelE/ParE family toxin [Vibrio ziniensis]
MSWRIEFYDGVEQTILSMPPKIQARIIRLLELIEDYGADLGEPHTKAMGEGLFEIRAKAQEGIARGLFCYRDGRNIIILHAFVKKSLKTPNKDIKLAKNRMKEVKYEWITISKK